MPTLVHNEPAGSELRRLVFDRPPAGYTVPGQYVLAHAGEHRDSFFAIASSPGEPLTLLVKRQGETAMGLCELEVGGSAEVSEARGPGFAIDRTHGRPLVLLVNGSGISAARPVVRAELARGLSRPVHLYYGVLTPHRRSFLADLEDWGNRGVRVTTVVGEPAGTGWTGRTGFVQHAARQDGLCRDDVSVVLVGVRPMIDEAKQLWTAAGCPEDQLLLNF